MNNTVSHTTEQKDGLFVNSKDNQKQGEHPEVSGSACLFPVMGESLDRVTDQARGRKRLASSASFNSKQSVGGKRRKTVAESGELIHWGATLGEIMLALVSILEVYQRTTNTMARTEAATATELTGIYHDAREQLQKKVDEINSLDSSDENYATKANIHQTEYSEKNQEFQNLENQWQASEQSQGTAVQNMGNSFQEASQEATSMIQLMRTVATLLQTSL